MKKLFLLFAAMCCTMWANAQTAYTYVQQNGEKIVALGTAAFSVTDNPTVEFINGKAVMKIGTNTVAELPMDNGGQLVVEFTTSLADEALNKVSKTVTDAGYATIYSPFQLQVPASGDVEVYAPTYDTENNVLKCNDDTDVAGKILPVGTGLLLKNAGTVEFTISDGTATAASKGALSGTAIAIPTSSIGDDVYTLGHEKNNSSLFGFFKYSGENLGAGLAYLELPAAQAKSKSVMLSFEDLTSVSSIEQRTKPKDGKFLENGRIVIKKDGIKYNVNGQEVR